MPQLEMLSLDRWQLAELMFFAGTTENQRAHRNNSPHFSGIEPHHASATYSGLTAKGKAKGSAPIVVARLPDNPTAYGAGSRQSCLRPPGCHTDRQDQALEEDEDY